MKVLLSKGKILELKSVDLNMCEICIMGKQKMARFLTSGWVYKTENWILCT